jgi:S-adenosylmethionine-diacylglycerol 3-amino-3-carboxypropyl transferase
MSAGQPGQVEPPELLFGMSWEDPESDRWALQIQPGDAVLTIGSGGCNTFSLLLQDPGQVFAVDINPCQSHLLELKRAAIRRLDFEDLHSFLGLNPSARREEVFESLAGDLSAPALAYWRSRPAAVRSGVVYQGRYEQFLRHFRRLLHLTQGRKRIDGLFQSRSLEEQRRYFDGVWNTVQWRMLFHLLFNKRVLARRGLSADYFRFDDGSSSFAEGFLERAKRALCEIPIATNYFIAQYLLGRYTDPNAVPAWLQRENLPIVRQRLDRIEIVTADVKVWLAGCPEASIDAFSLSNICELMSLEDTARTFQQVARTAHSGARICFRNLMIPREVPETLKSEIQLREDTSRLLLAQDRSFAYSRVQAYVVAGHGEHRKTLGPDL